MSAEYIKSLVQVQLLELYKKILKASKKAEKAVSESAAHAAVVSSSSPQIEVHAAVVPASTVSA
ncbi:TPA: hypothetical protein DEP21_00560 [Patescibacteria group bacterium]|nr:hypothetical protein [Candidatus Gracilibacteria bacterium]